MKPFSSLTQRGQANRLRQLAISSLEHYALDIRRVQLLAYSYNAIFRVDTTDKKKYVLRVNIPNARSLTEISSEMMWLAALRQATDLVVPKPVLNRNGAHVTTTSAPGIPEERHCVVFGWVPGVDIYHRVSPETWEKLGTFMARLHDHADGFVPPAGFALNDLGRVLPLKHRTILWDEKENQDLITPERRAIFRRVADHAQGVLDRMYASPEGIRVLHADLHQGNARDHRGTLHALDFDDCAMGFPVQDIGIAFYYFQGYPQYETLCQAFKRGYKSLRSWPETEPGQIETVIAARELVLVNFLVQTENRGFGKMLPGFVARAENRLRTFLDLWGVPCE